MRNDNATFREASNRTTKSPRVVVRLAFDSAETDLVYLTSHSDCATPVGATVISGVIQNISSSSQSIDHETGTGKIGNMSFDFVDKTNQLTDLISAKLDSDKGLRRKIIRVYVGEEDYYDTINQSTVGLDFTDYVNVATHLVDSVTFHSGKYTFKTSDVQREEKKSIFVKKKTTLTAAVTSTATTINVDSTTGFSTVYFPTSSTAFPGAIIGLIKIDDEIISYTGKTSTSFTGCTRGVLNTTAAEHTCDLSVEQSRRKKVEEHIYYEGPAILILYAILTGSIYGTAYSFPDHWHLGIDGAFIRTSSFTAIGDDLWDPTDLSKGVVFRFDGLDKADGKLFIEKEILYPLSLYMPVYGNGELGLKRFAKVLTAASPVVVFDDNNIHDFSPLDYDLSAVRNTLRVNWNYERSTQDFRLIDLFVDDESQTLFGETEVKVVEFRGLAANTTSDELLKEFFLALRDRLAYPPYYLTITVPSRYNTVEVGDVVSVTTDQIRDPATGTSIDRTFEVQSTNINWITGDVQLQLYGTSTRPADIVTTLPVSSSVIADSWYTAAGTNITSVLTCSSTAGLHTVTSNGHLTGNANGALAIYYSDRALQINSGVTVTFDKNVRIYVKGTMTINGALESTGAGLTVGTGSTQHVGGAGNPTAGQAGYYGNTSSQDGVGLISVSGTYAAGPLRPEQLITRGQVSAIESFNIRYEGSSLLGLPADLRGSAGCGSGGVVINGPSFVVNGKDGGDGGAGLVIVSRGAAFGVNGYIKTTGEDGGTPTSYTAGSFTAFAGGGGGGAPGCMVWVIDGNYTMPVVTKGTNYKAQYGATPVQGTPLPDRSVFPLSTTPYSANYTGTYAITTHHDNYLIKRLNVESIAEDQQPDTGTGDIIYADDVTSITLAEHLNGEDIPNATFSTIEVSVVEPADSNYLCANIYYRVQGQDGWTYSGTASSPAGEWVIPRLNSNGAVIEVQARSVSITGDESLSGPYTSITLTDIENDDLSASLIRVPDCSGLEIFGQGNDTDFSGQEVKLAWRRVSIDPVLIGSEPVSMGAGAGYEDTHFSHYELTIKDNTGEVLRVEDTKDNTFTYTYERNAIDYLKLNGTAGANRTIQVELVAVSRQNQRSPTTAKLTVSNPAPTVETIEVFDMYKGCALNFAVDADVDYAYTEIHMSETPGFTPTSPTTLVTTLKGRTDYVAVTSLPNGGGELATNTTYYIKIIPYDLFGVGTTSSQVSFTTTYVENQDISSLSVGKLTAGTLAANIVYTNSMTVSSAGNIHSGQTAYDTGTGFWLEANTGTPRLSIGNSAGNKMLWNGTGLTITGTIDASTITGSTITGGTFQTATSNQRITINESSSNEIKVYADRGDGTYEVLAKMGLNSLSGYTSIFAGGSANCSRTIFNGLGTGLVAYFKSTGSHGIFTTTSQSGAFGLYATHSNGGASIYSEGYQNGAGAQFTSYSPAVAINTRTTVATSTAHLILSPATSAAVPSHSAGQGSFWVNNGGDLYYNKAGTTSWEKLNGQRSYAGYCDSSATGEIVPSGWSIAKGGTGVYTVTHNLGLSSGNDMAVTVTCIGSVSPMIAMTTLSTNSFEVRVYDTSSILTNNAFTFTAQVI